MKKILKIFVQRFLMTSQSDKVFITWLVDEHNKFKELLVDQATLHVFKIEAMISKIGGKASIGGMNGNKTCVSTVQICDNPYVGVAFFYGKAANIDFWSTCIKLGIDSDYQGLIDLRTIC